MDIKLAKPSGKAGITMIIVLLLSACVSSQPKHITKKNNQTRIKNLILMIGDGMGPQQVGLLMEFAKWSKHSVYKNNDQNTAIARFSNSGYIGLSMTGSHDALVNDSACSATQLASGVSSRNEMIGLNANGVSVPTILEKAKALGKATGLVSDTRITHATPAAFASHQRHRSMENAIALQMLSSNDVDVMLSGGLRHWLPVSVNTDPVLQNQFSKLINEPSIKIHSTRHDKDDLLAIAVKQGYQLAFNQQQMVKAQKNRVIGLFAASGMCDAIAVLHGKCKSQPSLAEMTKKALTILSQDPDGFFLMIEGGQIDWAGHNNDAGQLLHEMLRFDEAIDAVYEWVKNRQDTLVVITADHETGGFGFSYSRYQIPGPEILQGKLFDDQIYQQIYNYGDPKTLDLLYQQKESFANMWKQARAGNKTPTVKQLLAAINNNSEFKINQDQAKLILQDNDNDVYFMKSKIHLDKIGRQLSKQQNVVWSTGTHTDTPVPVIVWGPEQLSRRFSKLMNHTDLGKRMIGILTE